MKILKRRVDLSDGKLCRMQKLPSIFNGITVNGSFNCSGNKLTSLRGAPTTVNGDFSCSDNQLTSLQGAPTTVDGNFDCSNNNQLTSLQGCPTTVDGHFYCCRNRGMKITEDMIRAVCNVKGKVIL
jgi:hypothetical protein